MNRYIALAVGIGMALVAAGVAGTRHGPAAAGCTRASGTSVRHPQRSGLRRRENPSRNDRPRARRIDRGRWRVSLPSGVESIDGDGRTLLPGFIDAHTHAFGDALERALASVSRLSSTCLLTTAWRRDEAEQQRPDGGLRRADRYLRPERSLLLRRDMGPSTWLVIPTLESPRRDAQRSSTRASRKDRTTSRSSMTTDRRSGCRCRPSPERCLQQRLRRRRRAGSWPWSTLVPVRAAADAIDAGASGLVHIFADAAADDEFVKRRCRGWRSSSSPTLSSPRARRVSRAASH